MLDLIYLLNNSSGTIGSAGDLCKQMEPILRLVGIVVFGIKVVVPIMLIIVGMLDLAKAVTEKKKEELKIAAIYLTAIGSFTIGAACGGHLANYFSYRTIWISCGLLILCFLLMLIKEEEDLETAEKKERQELKKEQEELKEEKKELQKEQKELQKEQNELKEDQKIIREMDEKTQHHIKS